MPPAILADLLGLSESSAAHWCVLAGGDWNSNAAHAAQRYTTNTWTPPNRPAADEHGARRSRSPGELQARRQERCSDPARVMNAFFAAV